ncbi:MAG: PLP-dependent aminotransferase family protein [Cyanobacteria bacterium HKST-UBA02]|nr:PLP-dependent aminotransferase family protein [Cyanobacteria bacterium HKST-UBA02]
MPRQSIAIDLPISLKKRSRIPLSQQLYEEVRRLILEGLLEPGAPMPSSRALASSSGLARATVIAAYEQLKAEGYIDSLSGSHTTVARELSLATSRTGSGKARESRQAILSPEARVFEEGSSLYETPPDCEICFYPWRIDHARAPLKALTRTMASVAARNRRQLIDYPTDHLGFKPLRKAIAQHLARFRGIKCDTDQILIVNGLPQALSLIAGIHLDPSAVAIVENPCYQPIVRTFKSRGASIKPLGVDSDGIKTAPLVGLKAGSIRLIYLTPSHQYPTGSALSLQRRLELLDLASRTGAVIIEDEHDSEFFYTRQPLAPLKSLDGGDSVIFVGSFAKTIFPSLGLAYLVLPGSGNLTKAYELAREQMADQPPTIFQAALERFLLDGSYRRHLKKMSVVYSEKRQALIDALATCFPGRATIHGHQSGLHLLARLETGHKSAIFEDLAREQGVGILSTAQFYTGTHPENEYILGYAEPEPAAIREGIRRLSLI